MNLSKHVDPVVNKPFSTSSATLLNTPDRGRQPLLSSRDTTLDSHGLTPTHSYLARSKSTAALSGDAASCSPISPQLSKTPIGKSSEKTKHFFTTPEAIARRRTTHFGGNSSVEKKEKREADRENVLTPIPILKRAISPSVSKPKSPAPTSGGPSYKSSTRPVPAIVSSSIKLAITSQRPLSPGNVRPVKKDSKEDSKKKQEDIPPNPIEKESTEIKDHPAANTESPDEEKPRTPSHVTAENMQEPPALPTPVLASPTVNNKPFAGTTEPGEATRILAEKRRLAREQRTGRGREERKRRRRKEEKGGDCAKGSHRKSLSKGGGKTARGRTKREGGKGASGEGKIAETGSRGNVRRQNVFGNKKKNLTVLDWSGKNISKKRKWSVLRGRRGLKRS